MKINDQEKSQLIEFHERGLAIDQTIEQLLQKQQQLLSERDAWFEDVRLKYNIPQGQVITIEHNTGEITFKPKQ